MKVLFVVPRAHPNLSPWMNELTKLGCRVQILQYNSSDKTQVNFGDGVSVTNYSIYTHEEILEILRQSDACIIRSSFNLFTRGIVRSCKNLEINTYIFNAAPKHVDLGLLFLKSIVRMFLRIIFGYPFKEFTISRGLGKYEIPWMEFIEFNHDFMRERQYSQNKRLINSKLTIVCVSQIINPRKRLIWLLEACSKLSSDINLIIITEGSPQTDRQLRTKNIILQRIGQMPANINVTLYESISNKDVLRIYNSSDIVALPASNEPFGYSIFEAISNNCPVVVSNTCGSAYYAVKDSLAYVFKNNSFSSFESNLYAAIMQRRRNPPGVFLNNSIDNKNLKLKELLKLDHKK